MLHDSNAPSDIPTGPSSVRVGAAFDSLRDDILNVLRNEATYANKITYLEGQLNLYMRALNDAETQFKVLKEESQKEKEDLENKIKLWQGHRIVTLLDGDGAIFSTDLMNRGKAGGQEAAKSLSEGILQGVKDRYGAHQYQLLVYLFLNKRGLMDALGRAGQVQAKHHLEDFLMGFNQAAERFLVVDVGNVKEAADAKIKTHLDDAIRMPQTFKIVFGGCHDNGYVANLRSHITAGYQDKLLLLKTYSNMAAGIADLELPAFDIPELFFAQKLPTFLYSVPSNSPLTNFDPTPDPVESDQSSPQQTAFTLSSYSSAVRAGRRRVPTPDLYSSGNTSSEDEILDAQPTVPSSGDYKYLTPGIPLSKQKPPPCTLHYLSTCKFGADCIYGHNYLLNEDQLAEIKSNAKKSPCPALNKGEPCYWGDLCCYGHYCSMSTKCYYYKVGKCKFRGVDMHKGPKNEHKSKYSDDTKERW